MDASLYWTRTFTCPLCSKTFDAGAWVVIDATHRPDLLQRIRDDNLFEFICCPHCEEFDTLVDTPLLVYREDKQPRLLFSPAMKTTTRQDSQVLAQLITTLRTSLSNTWQENWLQDSLVIAHRCELPELVSDAKEQFTQRHHPPLRDLVAKFIDTRIIPYTSYFLLKRYKELLSEEAIKMLKAISIYARLQGEEEFADAFSQHLELLRDCKIRGVELVIAEEIGISPQELERQMTKHVYLSQLEAMRQLPPDFREDLDLIVQAGYDYVEETAMRLWHATVNKNGIELLFSEKQEAKDFEIAIDAYYRIANNTYFLRMPQIFRLIVLFHAAIAFLWRYQQVRQLNDLDLATRFLKEIVDYTLAPVILCMLGNAFSMRYEHMRKVKDLEDAIDYYQRAIGIISISRGA